MNSRQPSPFVPQAIGAASGALRLARIAPLLLLLSLWEIGTLSQPGLAFFLGRPTKIATILATGILDGSAMVDLGVTLTEAGGGFLIGTVVGTMVGLGLWYLPRLFFVAEPYVVALGAAPMFALAPVVILWFGTGLAAKVAIAALSTVFIALYQAYWGASSANAAYLTLLATFGASKAQVFRKVIAPSAITSVMRAFRMNVGFALLGAFIGEYISSTAGVGHMILVASGLLDMSRVLAGVALFIVAAFVMLGAVTLAERPLRYVVTSRL